MLVTTEAHIERGGANSGQPGARGDVAGLFETGPSLVSVLDDDEPVRQGLTRLIRSARYAVEAFGSAREFLGREPHNGPWCLILDVEMPGVDGLKLQETLSHREVQIVFLTGRGDIPMCAKAMKAGAVDFLVKPVDEEILLTAVHRALERSDLVRKQRAERTLSREKLNRLTPREFQVLQHVIAGLLNKEIAADLGAAEKTVKIHRGRVMEKMGVSSVAELVRLAEMAGVAPARALH